MATRTQHVLTALFLRAATLGSTMFFVLICARLTGPIEFGKYALCMAIIFPCALLVHANQDTSLTRMVININDDPIRRLKVSAVIFGRFVGSLLVAFIAVLVCGALGVNLDQGGMAGIFMVTISLGCPLHWLAQSYGEIGLQNLMLFLLAALPLLAVIGFLSQHGLASSILLLHGFGSMAAFLISLALAIRRFGIPLISGLDLASIRQLCYSNNYLFASGFCVYAYTTFEQVIIERLLSVSDLGVYRTASQFGGAMAGLAPLIPQLFYRTYITHYKSGGELRLWQWQKVTIRRTAPLVLVLAFILAICVKYYYPILFGPAYQSGVNAAVWLIFSKCCVILNGIFAYGLWASQRDRLVLIILFGVACISPLLNLCFIPYWGFMAAAVVNFLSELLILLALAFAAYMVSRKPTAISATSQ